MDEKEGFELKEKYIVLAIPKDTVEVEITAKVWHKGEAVSVSKKMDFDKVREMFKEAEDGYIPSNAAFTLTDLGRETLAALKEEQLRRMDDAE